MASFIVTGSSGFIGRALVDYLLGNNHSVVGVSRSNSPLEHSNYTHHTLDLFETKDLAKSIEGNHDYIVHLAWLGSTGSDRLDFSKQMSNLSIIENLFKLAKNANVKKIIGIGTITELELNELDKGHVSSAFAYALAKDSTRKVIQYESLKTNIDYQWIRLGNTYGPNDPTKRFLSMLIEKMLLNESIDLTSGEQFYDFVHVDDVVRGIEAISINEMNSKNYYLGTGKPRELKKWILDLKNILNSTSVLNFGAITGQSVNIPAKHFYTTGLFHELGFRTMVSFEDGINSIENVKK